MKKPLSVLVLLIVLLAGCTKETLTQLTLEPDSLSMNVGEERPLALHGNIPVSGDVIWNTSNDIVAAVDKDGIVTAISEGMAVISAQSAGCVAFCEVTVTDDAAKVEKVEFVTKQCRIAVGLGEQLVAKAYPEGQDVHLKWSVEDPSVASVDENGFLTALAVGQTEVTVTADEVSATCPVVVCPLAGIGDYYYADGTYSYELDESKEVVGIVFLVNADGCSGKILSLHEEYLEWGPSDVTTNARDGMNGLVNMATIKAIEGWHDSFPAMAMCADKNDGGLEWYLPADMELRQMYAASFGFRLVLSGADATKGEVNDWGIGPSFEGFADEANIKKREEFNARITAIEGADPYATDEWKSDYWSSTEQDYGLIYKIHCDTGLISVMFSSSPNTRVRPIALF